MRGGEVWPGRDCLASSCPAGAAKPGPGGQGRGGGARRRGGVAAYQWDAGATPERGGSLGGVTACGFAGVDLTPLLARNRSGTGKGD